MTTGGEYYLTRDGQGAVHIRKGREQMTVKVCEYEIVAHYNPSHGNEHAGDTVTHIVVGHSVNMYVVASVPHRNGEYAQSMANANLHAILPDALGDFALRMLSDDPAVRWPKTSFPN